MEPETNKLMPFILMTKLVQSILFKVNFMVKKPSMLNLYVKYFLLGLKFKI